MPDTKLFWRNYPGGPSIIIDKEVSTGDFYWVDSGDTANGSNATGSESAPCLTIAAALALATASQNDIIFLKEGHAETLTAAISIAKAGVQIIALGKGDERATLTCATNATAAFTVSAEDVVIDGHRYICNVANQTEMIDVAADDCEIRNCDFLEGSATGLAFITADSGDGVGDNLWIHDNKFYAPTAGNYDEAINIGVDLVNVLIERNNIYGDFDEACIEIPAGGNACLNVRILDNELTNLQTGQHVIQINSTAVTGMIADNKCQTDTQGSTIDGAACSCHNNTWLDSDGSNDEEAIPVNAPIAGTIAAGNDAVPTADTTDNALTADVLGNKEDAAAAGAVSTTESVVAFVKQNVGANIALTALHGVPVADTTDDVNMRDVTGKKDDAAAAGAVSTGESLMAYAKQNVGANIDLIALHGVPAKDTTDDANMSDVVGKKEDDAAAGSVTTTESIVAYAKQNVGANIDLVALHVVPAADTTDDANVRDAVGKKDDAVLSAVGTTKSVMAYVKSIYTEQLAYKRSVRKTAAFTAGAGTGNVGTFALFTVTGGVELTLRAVCTETLAGAATIEVGFSGDTAVLIAQVADATDLDAGDVWHDNTPDAAYELGSVYTSRVLGNGQDIFVTIGSVAITDGTIEFTCEWQPLTDDGAIVAA